MSPGPRPPITKTTYFAPQIVDMPNGRHNGQIDIADVSRKTTYVIPSREKWPICIHRLTAATMSPNPIMVRIGCPHYATSSSYHQKFPMGIRYQKRRVNLH